MKPLKTNDKTKNRTKEKQGIPRTRQMPTKEHKGNQIQNQRHNQGAPRITHENQGQNQGHNQGQPRSTKENQGKQTKENKRQQMTPFVVLRLLSLGWLPLAGFLCWLP